MRMGDIYIAGIGSCLPDRLSSETAVAEGEYDEDSRALTGTLSVSVAGDTPAPDLAIAREATSLGLAPTPLSLWYASKGSVRPGLLLGVATSPLKRIEASCERLGVSITLVNFMVQDAARALARCPA